MAASRFLVLGAGYAGSAAARLAHSLGRSVVVTVRSAERARELDGEGFVVLSAPELDASIASHIDRDTDVLVAFQPHPGTDALVAPLLSKAHGSVYISSTGVYGNVTGHVDDDTMLPFPLDDRARKILDAEAHYRNAGATILRCPGIYGPDRGLHMRLLRGEHRIPGDGDGFLSRIHVEDLAQFVLAAVSSPPETFVVGDAEPARHIDVVRFVCETHDLPMPERIPLESVHASLRANRRVDSSRARRVLNIALRYPTFREGMAALATRIEPRQI
jgi:nucleoside-diphosphate-sugar epimerase